MRHLRHGSGPIDTALPAANVILAGILTGNEWAGWTVVHPALDRLPPGERLHAEQAIYRRFGKIMPFLMSSTVVSGAMAATRTADRRSRAFALTATGTGCYAAMLAVTLTRNVPINKELLALTDEPRSHGRLAELRRDWDRLHTVRNLLNLAGLALTVVGALEGASRRR